MSGKDYGYCIGQKPSEGVTIILNLIILIATARIANIHNRNTWFLYKKRFLNQNSILKKFALYFMTWLVETIVLYMDGVTTGRNQTRLF